jgi:hypothetical protein
MACRFPDKVKHPDKDSALAHIRSLYRNGKGCPDYAAYPCDGGRHWHVGHSQLRMHKRIRRALAVGNATTAHARRIRARR